jgi:hypothetical protein
MPTSTSLKCPQCGHITQTTRAAEPGDKVRCAYCRRVIRVRHPQSDLVEDPAIGGSMGPELLRELLAPEDRPTQDGTSNQAQNRYRSVTNEPLSPDSSANEPFSRNPLAPASARSKDRLIGGKGVRFTGSREFTAVVLIVGVMAVGYLVYWGLHGLYRDIEKASDRFAVHKEKGYNPATGSATKRTSKVKTANAPPSRGETRIEAGNPQKIGVTEVRIVSARRGAFGGSGGLTITLRITNHSPTPITYYKKQLTLRDRAAAPQNYPLLGPPTENPKVGGRETIEDVLEFGPTPVMLKLDLELPASGSDERFEFSIPPTFIQTTP